MHACMFFGGEYIDYPVSVEEGMHVTSQVEITATATTEWHKQLTDRLCYHWLCIEQSVIFSLNAF